MAVPAAEARPDKTTQTSSAGPAEPVCVAKVRSYDQDLTRQFRQMFDQIGGIGNQVKGKTVGIKVNLTGGSPFPGYTVGDTHWVHPHVVGAAVAAFGALGAKRVRILEGAESRKHGYRLEDKLLSGGWDVAAIGNAAPLVEFEDTDRLGDAKQYSLMKVQSKPYVFPAFLMNHSYEDCDFFVSMGKRESLPLRAGAGAFRCTRRTRCEVEPLRGLAATSNSGRHCRRAAGRPRHRRRHYRHGPRRGPSGSRVQAHSFGSTRCPHECCEHRHTRRA